MSNKKTVECQQLNKFLESIKYGVSNVKEIEDDGLDFIINSKIGVQITEYHSGVKEEGGCQRRQVEREWSKLQNELVASVKKCPELKEIHGVLKFKELKLPRSKEYAGLIQEIIKASLGNLPKQLGEEKVVIPSNEFPLMNRYLASLKLKKVDFPVSCQYQWDWPSPYVVWLGPTEAELISIVEPKIKKCKKLNLEETWLLIVSGPQMSQTLTPYEKETFWRS